MKKTLPNELKLYLIALVFGLSSFHLGFGQNILQINFTGTQMESVQVGAIFAVSAEVEEVNGSSVPAGETVIATLEFRDPSGIVVASHTQTWNGFPEAGTTGLLSNDPNRNQVLFQVPWSEDNKFDPGTDNLPGTADDNKWSVVATVSGASLESDLTDNQVSHPFSLRIPNLAVSNNLSVSAMDPSTGLLSSNFYPNTNVTVSGSIQNDSLVRTQEGVVFPVTARLSDADGNVVDEETIVLPDPGQSPVSIAENQIVPFTINNLRLPSDAEFDSNFTVEVIVDEQPNPQVPSAGVIPEGIEDHVTNTTDNRASINFTTTTGNAVLSVDGGSFSGDIGEFAGLDPIRIAFAIRNEGPVSIQTNDSFTVIVALSEDDSFSSDDFILREFDMGGSGLGANLLPNETVGLDWVQQLPDNFEGDYYLVIHILETDQNFSLQNTPTITLTSLNDGTTSLFDTNASGSATERPSSSNDGKVIAYERTISGIRHVFLQDMRSDPVDVIQITDGANASSFRPKVSGDGSAVVFHSLANNLTIGDTNGHEDIFYYSLNSGLLDRAIDFKTGGQTNGGSFYPDINDDGTIVVFETESSTFDENQTRVRHIALWEYEKLEISILTSNANGDSREPSISNTGDKIVFASDATNLDSSDSNEVTDIFLYEKNANPEISRINLNHNGNQTEDGPSDQPRISGDGNIVTFRSEALNMITAKGISIVEVISGGAGYLGNPTITVTDAGGSGTGAQLNFAANGRDVYGQIAENGIEIFDHGTGYVEPIVTVIPDPAFPAPTQTATINAHISHPRGEVYAVDLRLAAGDSNWIRRISENSSGVGGDSPSRDATPSEDGERIVFSTQSSNLQEQSVTRADGKTFFNHPIRQASANAIILGGIGEIEVGSPGSGYQNGFLTIDDLSGTGSGAVASYQVDTFGRISSINMVNTGTDYNLDTTTVSVQNPRGGTGFLAGAIRFVKEFGGVATRGGGGRVYRVEMVDHGKGYEEAASSTQGLEGLITIDGDGIDVDQNGAPDAKINPALIHIDSYGGIYLEQSFDVEILSSASLLTSVISFQDANQSITIDFAPSDSPPLTVGILGKSLNQIRNDIIEIIEAQWSNPADIKQGPQMEYIAGANQFTFNALSGRVTLNDFSSIKATPQSNMLFSGSGFTRATPIIAPAPTIHGFSEILATPSSGNTNTNGRNIYLDQPDNQTDDIYLYDWNQSNNKRVSRSSFGFPVNYLGSSNTSMPSNRFPTVSGNGRFVFFSSDSSGGGGLVFNGSNQNPADTDATRDIFMHDSKSLVITNSEQEISTEISLVGVPPLKFKFGDTAIINLRVKTDDDANADRVYLFNGPQMINPNNSASEFIQFNVNNPMHQAGFFPFEFNATTAGKNEFRAMVIDSHGSQRFQDEAFEVEIIRIASLSPVIELLNWDANSNAFSITSTSKILLSATASDDDGAIERVQFYVNGLPYGNPISYDSNFSQVNYPYSIEWSPEVDFNASSNDYFLIYAKASDTSGNEIMSQPVLYQVTAGGQNIPILSMESLNESYVGGKTIFLSVDQISDLNEHNDSGIITEVSFVVNGVIMDTQTNAPYFFPYTPNQDGLYEVYALAKDNEGNYGISNRQTFEVNDSVGTIDTPVLGSTFPSVTGQALSFTEERRFGRRSLGLPDKKDYTRISGFNTEFLNQLSKDQTIRFSVGEEITEQTYVVSEITNDNELVLDGNVSTNDKTLLGKGAEIQIVQSFRVGSLIPMFLKDEVDDVEFQSVDFYADGDLQGRDQSWPFSSAFVPQTEGNYTLGVVANTAFGSRSLYTERIYVEPKIGTVPDGTTSLTPTLSRAGSTTIGSELIVSANYEDLDENGMNRVEFYLNGKLMHVDREKPYCFKFRPQTDASILFTDRFWEVTALGFDDDGNCIALVESGSVAGGFILPTAEIKSPLDMEEFSDGQSMQVRIDIKGSNLDRLLGPSSNTVNPNTTLSPRMMNVHANGEIAFTAIETSWGSGSFTGEWVCDKNMAGDSNIVELVGSIVMSDDNVGGLNFSPVVMSDVVKIKVVEPNLGGSPKAAINQTFIDMLGYSPAEQEVNLSFSEEMADGQYLFDNQDFLDWVVELTSRDNFQNMVDAISGYHTMTGQWPDYLKTQDIINNYSAIPNNGSDGTLDSDGDGFSARQERVFRTSDSDPADFPTSAFNVGAFVDETLSSREFTNIHGPLAVMTPPANGPDRFTNYEENRRDFVRTVFNNKYGRKPTVQQEIQGSYRISVFDPNSQEARMDQQRQMLQQMAMLSSFGGGGFGGGGRGGNNNNNLFGSLLGNINNNQNNQNQQTQPTYQSGQPAVLFVANMIAEEKIDNMDLIWSAEPKRGHYEIAALITTLWQDNLGLLSDDLVNQFYGMPTNEIISTLMKDSRYFSRFGGYSISRLAQEIPEMPGWKWLEWLGHFNDAKFPWVYHSGLGWLYVHGLTDDQTWFHLPSAGWLGTTKEIWEDMDNRSSYLWLYEQSTSRWVAYVLEEPAEGGADLILYEESTSKWVAYDSTKHAGKLFWDPSEAKYFVY